MTEPLLRIEALHVGFRTGTTFHNVVRGVDLRVDPGEVVGLVGESGSGKSITALAVMRLLPPRATITSGRVSFRSQDMLDIGNA